MSMWALTVLSVAAALQLKRVDLNEDFETLVPEHPVVDSGYRPQSLERSELLSSPAWHATFEFGLPSESAAAGAELLLTGKLSVEDASGFSFLMVDPSLHGVGRRLCLDGSCRHVAETGDVNLGSITCGVHEVSLHLSPKSEHSTLIFRVPCRHAIFVKTVKTGSSSITAMFHRVAQDGLASVEVPSKFGRPGDWFKVSEPYEMRPTASLRHGFESPNATFDYLVSHILLRSWAFDFVPKDPVIVTIVRDPVAQLVSGFLFFVNPHRSDEFANMVSQVRECGPTCCPKLRRLFHDNCRATQACFPDTPPETLQRWARGEDPNRVFLVLERMVESAAVLALTLRWPLSYASVCHFKQSGRAQKALSHLTQPDETYIRSCLSEETLLHRAADSGLDRHMARFDPVVVAQAKVAAASRACEGTLDHYFWNRAFWRGDLPNAIGQPKRRMTEEELGPDTVSRRLSEVAQDWSNIL